MQARRLPTPSKRIVRANLPEGNRYARRCTMKNCFQAACSEGFFSWIDLLLMALAHSPLQTNQLAASMLTLSDTVGWPKILCKPAFLLAIIPS